MSRRLALTTLGLLGLAAATAAVAAPVVVTPDFGVIHMTMQVQDLSTGETVSGSYGSELDWVPVVGTAGQVSYELRGTPQAVRLGGSWARFDQGTSFDPDPVLLLAGSAVNNSSSSLLYTFSFNAPMAPALTGLINSTASLSLTLADGAGDGASIATFGSDIHMLQSVDFSIAGQVPKGVDVGTGPLQVFAGALSPGTTQTFNTSGSLICAVVCTAMGARMSFVLSAGDAMSFSGRITQDLAPVPVPAALWLLCSGLGTLGTAVRRSRKSLPQLAV